MAPSGLAIVTLPMTKPLAAAVCNCELLNREPDLSRQWTDNVQSRALHAEGVCKNVNVLIDNGLRFEQRGIFVIYVSTEHQRTLLEKRAHWFLDRFETMVPLVSASWMSPRIRKSTARTGFSFGMVLTRISLTKFPSLLWRGTRKRVRVDSELLISIPLQTR